MPDPSEPKVPKPNRTACGFNNPDGTWIAGSCVLIPKAHGWVRLGCMVAHLYPFGQARCPFGKLARALHARQEADRKGRSEP